MITAKLINIETGQKTNYYNLDLQDILKSVRGIFFKGREHIGRLYQLDVYFLNRSFRVADLLKGEICENSSK